MTPDDDGRGPRSKDEDKPPESEEEYAEAVTRHAKYLGIDPEIDAAYMWIAEEVGTTDSSEPASNWRQAYKLCQDSFDGNKHPRVAVGRRFYRFLMP